MDLLLYINKNTLAAWRNLPCDKRVFLFIKYKMPSCRSPPLSIIKKIDKEKSGMKSGKNQYGLTVNL